MTQYLELNRKGEIPKKVRIIPEPQRIGTRARQPKMPQSQPYQLKTLPRKGPPASAQSVRMLATDFNIARLFSNVTVWQYEDNLLRHMDSASIAAALSLTIPQRPVLNRRGAHTDLATT